jgi:hypothetical protein
VFVELKKKKTMAETVAVNNTTPFFNSFHNSLFFAPSLKKGKKIPNSHHTSKTKPIHNQHLFGGGSDSNFEFWIPIKNPNHKIQAHQSDLVAPQHRLFKKQGTQTLTRKLAERFLSNLSVKKVYPFTSFSLIDSPTRLATIHEKRKNERKGEEKEKNKGEQEKNQVEEEEKKRKKATGEGEEEGANKLEEEGKKEWKEEGEEEGAEEAEEEWEEEWEEEAEEEWEGEGKGEEEWEQEGKNKRESLELKINSLPPKMESNDYFNYFFSSTLLDGDKDAHQKINIQSKAKPKLKSKPKPKLKPKPKPRDFSILQNNVKQKTGELQINKPILTLLSLAPELVPPLPEYFEPWHSFQTYDGSIFLTLTTILDGWSCLWKQKKPFELSINWNVKRSVCKIKVYIWLINNIKQPNYLVEFQRNSDNILLFNRCYQRILSEIERVAPWTITPSITSNRILQNKELQKSRVDLFTTITPTTITPTTITPTTITLDKNKTQGIENALFHTPSTLRHCPSLLNELEMTKQWNRILERALNLFVSLNLFDREESICLFVWLSEKYDKRAYLANQPLVAALKFYLEALYSPCFVEILSYLDSSNNELFNNAVSMCTGDQLNFLKCPSHERIQFAAKRFWQNLKEY